MKVVGGSWAQVCVEGGGAPTVQFMTHIWPEAGEEGL
jgi:hypothetical protein